MAKNRKNRTPPEFKDMFGRVLTKGQIFAYPEGGFLHVLEFTDYVSRHENRYSQDEIRVTNYRYGSDDNDEPLKQIFQIRNHRFIILDDVMLEKLMLAKLAGGKIRYEEDSNV